MKCRQCGDKMKNKYLQIRISERRLNKFRLYAANRDKTMTQIIEDFIDSLIDNNGKKEDTHSIN